MEALTILPTFGFLFSNFTVDYTEVSSRIECFKTKGLCLYLFKIYKTKKNACHITITEKHILLIYRLGYGMLI